ncbi:MAG: flagellar type III secretion system protein FlhB [Pseudomonadota bacterium]
MAQNEDSGQEKTLDPTPQRLERARQDGDVAKSQDLAAVAGYIGVMIALLVSAGAMGLGFAAPLSSFIASPQLLIDKILGGGGPAIAGEIIGYSLLALAPLFLFPMAAVIIVLFAQRAIVFAPSKLEPKLSRISPISNAGQKFGPTGLMEFAKSVVKLIAIGAILVAVFLGAHDGVAALVEIDARALPELLLQEAMLMLGAAIVIAGAIAALDVVWQQYDHRRRLRMTVQEMRDESKETDGDPTMKMTRQQKARQIAMNRAMEEVPKADVVIVNPLHYAVALKWSRAPGSAPVCVAKGVDEIALKMREIAGEHKVPIHEDPPTARALYATVEIDQEIDNEHYQAVAVAIRFADAMRAKAMTRKGTLGGR